MMLTHVKSGFDASTIIPGDIGLVRNLNPWYTFEGLFSACIRFAQRLVYRKNLRIYTKYSHAFVIINTDGTIMEALAKGITTNHISKYHDTEYTIVHLNMDEESFLKALKFALSVNGVKYGYLTIVAMAINAFTGTKIALAWGNHMICSEFAARFAEHAGEIFNQALATVMPATLAAHYQVLF